METVARHGRNNGDVDEGVEKMVMVSVMDA